MKNSLTLFKYINGGYVEIPSVEVGVTFNEELSDVLNSCVCKFISTDNELIPPYNTIKVVENGVARFFIIASDVVERISHTVESYRHTLYLVEATKYLERILMPNQAFTRDEEDTSTTMLDHINMALINAEPLQTNAVKRFSLDAATQAIFEALPSEDFYFEKPTLREVLDAMFAVANRRCYVSKIESLDSIVISSLDLNPTGNLIEHTDSTYFTSSNSIEYQSEVLEAYADNAILTNKYITHGWDTLKTIDGSTLTSDNGYLNLTYPIYDLKSYLVKCSVKFSCLYDTGYTTGSTTYTTDNVEIDLSNYCVPSETYAILTEQEKTYTFYYEQGSNNIRSSITYKKLFFTTSVLKQAVADYISNHLAEMLVVLKKSYPYATSVLSGECTSDISNIQHKLVYTPYVNLHATISKAYSSSNKTAQIDNQSEKNLNIDRYSIEFKKKLQRYGNNTLIYDTVCEHSDLLELGDYDSDGYVLSSREYSVTANYIKAHYIFTKNYSSSIVKTSIDREKKVYNIPLTSVTRDNLIKGYMLFSTSTPTGINSNIINSAALKRCAESLIGTCSEGITKCYFRRSTTLTNFYLMDVLGYSFANSNVFRIEMLDNYSAGYGTGQRILGGKKATYNPYVDTSTGRYSANTYGTIQLVLATRAKDDLTLSQVSGLPSSTLSYSNSTDLMTNTTTSTGLLLTTYKDAYVKDTFSLQIEYTCASGFEDKIVIGNAFAKYNNLIGNGKSNLKLWLATVEYKQTDERCKGTLLSSPLTSYLTIGDDYISINSAWAQIRGTKAWAIGTSDGELLIGVNGVSKIYFALKLSK